MAYLPNQRHPVAWQMLEEEENLLASIGMTFSESNAYIFFIPVYCTLFIAYIIIIMGAGGN